MKKAIILLIILTFIVSAAIASTLYYTTRNGEVLEVGSWLISNVGQFKLTR